MRYTRGEPWKEKLELIYSIIQEAFGAYEFFPVFGIFCGGANPTHWGVDLSLFFGNLIWATNGLIRAYLATQ